ncbi:MAG TPA: hypothetical protein DCP64_04415, partial [Sarcina sp.]|nr:hypothetical protein [Sarcina sp.]
MIKNKTNPTDTELKVPAETGEETANAESGTGEQTTAEGSGSGEQTIVAGSGAPESEAPEAGSLTAESPTDDSVSAAPSEVPE